MKFLVDANVLSEATKPQPDPGVLAWLRKHERQLVVDPVILGEVQFGILLLPKGKRRTSLERWFDAGVQRIHCIPFEAKTGLAWASLLARLRGAGHSMPVKDSLIAATALANDLVLATRNEEDFKRAGVTVVNPFQG